MKYLKDQNNQVYAFEHDGSQDAYILPELIPLTAEEVEQHLYDAPTMPKTQFLPLEFLEKFTEQEQILVVTATMQVPQVKLWYDKMLGASFVDLTDQRTVAGLDALVEFGLLTETRKDEILGE